MTRWEAWVRLCAAAMERGNINEQARLSADEQLAHADERWPSEQMTWTAPRERKEGE